MTHHCTVIWDKMMAGKALFNTYLRQQIYIFYNKCLWKIKTKAFKSRLENSSHH